MSIWENHVIGDLNASLSSTRSQDYVTLHLTFESLLQLEGGTASMTHGLSIRMHKMLWRTISPTSLAKTLEPMLSSLPTSLIRKCLTELLKDSLKELDKS